MPDGYFITALTLPDYDEFGPDTYWTVSEWIEWHKKLVAQYGQPDANRRFLDAYHKAPFAAVSYDWRSYDTQFRDYAKANRFYDGLFRGLGGLVARFTSLFGSTAEATTGAVDNIGGAVRDTSAALKTVLPLLIVAAALVLIFAFYKQFKTS